MSGDFIRGALYVLDIPQKVISERTGIDAGTLSKYLGGDRVVPERHLADIWVAVGEVKAERAKRNAASTVCQAA